MPLVFSLIFIVVSRLLHPYSTDDKTSRLMVKQFSMARNTQRGSQSYIDKRRGRREIEVTRRRRGRVKRRETNLANNQFPDLLEKTLMLGRTGDRRRRGRQRMRWLHGITDSMDVSL